MSLGKNFHIAAQIMGLGSQTLMGPAATLWGWDPNLVTFLHAIVSFAQAALGIIALNVDPNIGKPNDAAPLSSLKDLK